MTQSRPSARKRDGHETIIRNVVDFAHEVRIQTNASLVIFGSVTEPANRQSTSFRIRPWGLGAAMSIQFDDVSVAAPVKQMSWERHCAIAAAQHAGIFSGVRKPAR